MDRSSPQDVTIIDKDESSEQSYNVVDGFVIEDSKSPFPVSVCLSVLVCVVFPVSFLLIWVYVYIVQQ